MARLHWALTQPEQPRARIDELRRAAAGFDWGEMASRYDGILSAETGARA